MDANSTTSRENQPAAANPARRFRLGFAIQRYFDFGGLQRDMLRIASACAAAGHEVHVLTSDWSGERPANLDIHLLPVKARINHGRSLQFSRIAGEFSRQHAFDCFVGFSKVAGSDVYFCGDLCLAERLRERKIPFWHLLPRYRAYLSLEQAIFGASSSTELLVLTEPEKERMARHYGTSDARMHLLPAGIDRRRFRALPKDQAARVSLRHELGIAETDFLMLTVGSGFKTKGIDRAIRALRSLPHTERMRSRLVVVGHGRASPFQGLARRLGVARNVTFMGGRSDVAEFYRAADLLIHPARTETTGLTLLEAMICGLPVLVTGNCGNAVHVERSLAGLVCPHPFRQGNLNRLLAQMLPEEARRRWQEHAFHYCARTDLYSMIERAVEVILARAARNAEADPQRRAA